MDKKKTILGWVIGLCVILTVIGVFFLARNLGYTAYANEPVGTNAENAFELQIREGDGILEIAEILKEEGMITSQAAFCLRAKFSEYDGLMKAGTYTINETMGTDDILAVITQTVVSN